jgi:hypothetical protein
MADARQREQPGTAAGPRHDREAAGPRGQDTAGGARQGADGTLAWSLTAMSEALRRLTAASAADIPQAVAASRQPPAAVLPRPQPGPGRPSPRRPRTAARHARPARTASTGHTSPAGPSDRQLLTALLQLGATP